MKRWNGWGDEQTIYPLSELANEYLINILGIGTSGADASLEEVIKSVPSSRLPKHASISIDLEDRLRHACGQSLPDWINLRSGRIPTYPDGVIYPGTDAEIQDTMAFAHENKIVLIPYGGGTSVVGHINPPQSNNPVLTIDLSKFNQVVDIDQTNQLANLEAGIRGTEIERQLNKHGYTLMIFSSEGSAWGFYFLVKVCQ